MIKKVCQDNDIQRQSRIIFLFCQNYLSLNFRFKFTNKYSEMPNNFLKYNFMNVF